MPITLRDEFARLASRYPATPSGLASLMGDRKFQRIFPEARVIDGTQVDFGDGRPVDIVRAADPAPKWTMTRCLYCATPSTPGVNCRNCGAP